jgi:FAD:protein FMN transferase
MMNPSLSPFRAVFAAFAAVLAAVAATADEGASGSLRNPAWGGPTMGSTYSIKLADSPLSPRELDQLKADVEKLLAEFNRQMSPYSPESEISSFNRSTSTAPMRVSALFAWTTRFALELYRRSDGAFDPTVGPLVNLWGFGTKGTRETPPSEAEIRAAVEIVGGRHLSVTENKELRKDIPQLQLDLSAVVAGLAAEEVAALLRSRGVSNYFIDVTTELVVSGHNPEGQAWRIGLETPNSKAGPGEELEAVLNVSDGAISTSGDYRKYFEDKHGRRYSHILDPRTGHPIDHDPGSVTVIAPDGLTADALATTLFVMGPERGLPWLKGWSDVEAIFIVRQPDGEYSEIASPGFERRTGYKPR